jgi:hypothetical protein
MCGTQDRSGRYWVRKKNPLSLEESKQSTSVFQPTTWSLHRRSHIGSSFKIARSWNLPSIKIMNLTIVTYTIRCGSAAVSLLELWVLIPLEAWIALLSVVFCQAEVSASGWSLVQRSPTECGVSECDREASIMRGPWPARGCCAVAGGGGDIYYLTCWVGGKIYNIL